MEPRESLALCATREVYEETGYVVDVADIIYIFEFYDKKIDSHKVESVFYATISKQPQKSDWEDLGHDKSVTMKKWFSLDEIKTMDNVQPQLLKDGKWLNSSRGDDVYKGYEESR